MVLKMSSGTSGESSYHPPLFDDSWEDYARNLKALEPPLYLYPLARISLLTRFLVSRSRSSSRTSTGQPERETDKQLCSNRLRHLECDPGPETVLLHSDFLEILAGRSRSARPSLAPDLTCGFRNEDPIFGPSVATIQPLPAPAHWQRRVDRIQSPQSTDEYRSWHTAFEEWELRERFVQSAEPSDDHCSGRCIYDGRHNIF